ncbi:MAG: hypothetical protein K9M07_00050 [Simkaniaceae bacterium]|nr:hypothetical protein [Simkaniaceae bacterium]
MPVPPSKEPDSSPLGFNPNLEGPGAPPTFEVPKGGYGGWTKFEQFLGPEGFKKFQSILENMIREQVSQEEQKAKKATQELKQAEEGQPWEGQ